jgi:hypothetical protein
MQKWSLVLGLADGDGDKILNFPIWNREFEYLTYGAVTGEGGLPRRRD